MEKELMVLILTVLMFLGCSAQKKLTEYVTSEGLKVNAGDTVEFLEGSFGGVFQHVYFMVGKVQKRKATFAADTYNTLVVDHFQKKKEKENEVTYAVTGVPNMPKWFVWVRIEEALTSNEVQFKPKKQ